MTGTDRVAIISNDCWGGDCYRYLGRRYESPFVGLFVHGPCYVAMLQDIDAVLQDDLATLTSSRYTHRRPSYPLLGLRSVGAELHMLHYETPRAAREAWRRRADRAVGLPVRVKASVGKDAFTDGHIEQVFELHPAAIVLGPAGIADERVVGCTGFDPSTVNFEASLRAFDLGRWVAEGRVVRRTEQPEQPVHVRGGG